MKRNRCFKHAVHRDGRFGCFTWLAGSVCAFCLLACGNQAGPMDVHAAPPAPADHAAAMDRASPQSLPALPAADDAPPRLDAQALDAALGRPVILNIAPPPGVEPGQLQLSDQAYNRAITPYEDVLQQLDPPQPLKDAAARRQQPGPIRLGDTEPSLEVQRLYLDGREAVREGRAMEAAQRFQAALELEPDEPEILEALAGSYIAMGNTARAAESMRRLIVEDHTHAPSFYLLGRLALDAGEMDDAIAYFEAARRALELADNKPLRGVLSPLVHARLAEALRRSGYGRAALEQFARYLTTPRDVDAATPLAAELFIVDRQQPAALIAMGDLYNQLDAPGQALVAYERALASSRSLAEQLLARQLYTYLRLGRQGQAVNMLVDRITALGPQPGLLRLGEYLGEQGVPTQALVDQLQQVYEQRDKPSQIALVLADLLAADDAATMLKAHLAEQPADLQVFDAMLWQVLLPDGFAAADAEQRRLALQAALDVMDSAPDYAGAYATRLVRDADDVQALVDTTSALADAPAVRQSPERAAHVAVLHGLGLYAQREFARAIDAFDRALEQNPDSTAARLQMVKLLLAQNHPERAGRLLQPILELRTAEIVALQSQILMETGRIDEAIALLRRTMRDTGLTPNMAILLARLELASDDVPAAERVLVNTLAKYPTSQQLYESLLELYRSGQEQADGIDNASAKMRRLVAQLFRVLPDSRLAQVLRARTLAGRGELQQAEAILLDLQKQDPDDVEINKLLVELYLQFNRREDARAAIEQLVEREPDDPAALQLAIAVYRQLGDREKLIESNEKLILTQPPSAERAATLAQLYVLAEQHDKAIETLKQAAEQYPDARDDLDYQRASVLHATGQIELYKRVLEQVVARNPKHAPSANGLGYQWTIEHQHLDRARQLIQNAVDQEPNVGAYLDSLGWVEYKLGRFDEAVDWLTRASEAPGGVHPVILDHLGDALYRVGDKDAALTHWRNALRNMQLLETLNDPETQALEDELPRKIEAAEQGKKPAIAPTAAEARHGQ